MKSWNIVFTGPKQAELIQEELPELQDNKILCRTEYTLISIGTESHCYNGIFDEGSHWAGWVKYPFHPGYSNVATVVEVGSAVSKFKPGDRVASPWHHRQYFLASEGDLQMIPDEVDSIDASWINLAGVAQRCVRKCNVQMGDVVAVIGQGPVGQLTTQFVRSCGALEIIAIDPVAARAEGAKLSGADYVLSCTAADALDEVVKITEGRLADIVIDTTGHPKVLAQACALVRTNGKVGLVGDTVTPSQQVVGEGLISKSINILGCGGGAHVPEDTAYAQTIAAGVHNKALIDWNHALTMKYLQKKRLNFKHLVSHRFSPKDAPAVYAALQTDRASYQGVVFDWSLLD